MLTLRVAQCILIESMEKPPSFTMQDSEYKEIFGGFYNIFVVGEIETFGEAATKGKEKEDRELSHASTYHPLTNDLLKNIFCLKIPRTIRHVE